MDRQHLDLLAIAVATRTRRRLVATLLAGLGGALGLARGAEPARASDRSRAKAKRKRCPRARKCGRKCCRPGQTCQGGGCVSPPPPPPDWRFGLYDVALQGIVDGIEFNRVGVLLLRQPYPSAGTQN
jgi:uncharacterized membrane protein